MNNTGYLYAIDFGTGRIKIGKSSNPDKRIMQIRHSVGLEVVNKYISKEIRNFDSAEGFVHFVLNNVRHNIGEWFNITFDDAKETIVAYENSISDKRAFITGEEVGYCQSTEFVELKDVYKIANSNSLSNSFRLQEGLLFLKAVEIEYGKTFDELYYSSRGVDGVSYGDLKLAYYILSDNPSSFVRMLSWCSHSNLMTVFNMKSSLVEFEWYCDDVETAIRDKIKPTGGTWNTATYDELEQRTKIENQLITVLKLDLVANLDHLLQIIDNL
jgi:hypothetical protein